MQRPSHGRGAAANPRNRFTELWVEPDAPPGRVATRVFEDDTRTVISTNASPDLPFTQSLNPYRGCEHGCAYCYARPTHEYLGLSAGLDFETQLFAKPRAASLLRDALAKPSYRPSALALSGVTDCYQPVEKELGITRACLEVLRDCRHPVSIVTKGALVARDAELLGGMARDGLASALLSITTLDPALARDLEPRASAPARKLRALEALAAAGVPVGVMVGPVIPGLNDHELPAILAAARARGASFAAYLLLRLPHGVRELFDAWLERHRPQRRERVLSRIRACRGGALSDPSFGSRMRGSGPYADQIRALFQSAARSQGLMTESPRLTTAHFRPPLTRGAQLPLFGT
ncbi:MAG: PA0069 family radical SAM protein [Planctomycetes bacterium]|nr:PA0069 family radical SAM protein [Planctomycetota bacterium]